MRDGAQGRNRTTDTAIFSRMLYQLSYLGRHPDTRAKAGSEGWSERLWPSAAALARGFSSR